MFFDKKLMENKSVAQLWRTAHNFEAPERENARPLHEIWKLDSWVSSEGLVRSQRLSLRTSSTLVAGAARVLLRELRSLCHDAQGMEKDLTLARKRLSVISEDPSLPSSPSSSTRSSPQTRSTPETMMKQPTEPLYTSTSEIRKRPLDVITSKDHTLQHSMSFSHDNDNDDHEISFIPTKRRKTKQCEDDGCETEESMVYSPEVIEGSSIPISKEQETQTVAFPEETAKDNSSSKLDPTKPYGCVFIYAKGNVVPSHIVVSNINPHILGLAR